MYNSEGKDKDMPSGTGKTKDPAFGWLDKNLDRPDSEQKRAKVPDQPSPKAKPGQRPFGKVPPADRADEETNAM
ncbi:MAG: hypothetical protein WA441_05135 [Methyloceanibacter sp.]